MQDFQLFCQEIICWLSSLTLAICYGPLCDVGPVVCSRTSSEQPGSVTRTTYPGAIDGLQSLPEFLGTIVIVRRDSYIQVY